jgi:uncharacterized protein with ACT and thioredoxin-like domain
MTIKQQDTLIIELIELAIEMGANEMYIRRLILVNGGDLRQAVCRGWIKDFNEDE